ncbi:MAG: arsenate reductase family protein [Ruminococcus sp.]|nr:arsenate reductase family protein [Ruminococcus sp.]
MNIQIFGKAKCFDTKKAERFFKERGIKYQFIDLKQKPMSRGELESVIKAVGGLEKVIDENSGSKNAALVKYLASDEAKKEKLLEDGLLLKTPIVRNGRQAAVGYQPDIWDKWTKE